MSSSRSYDLNPWPVQTPPPTPSSSASLPTARRHPPKRRRIHDDPRASDFVSPLEARQIIADQSELQQASIDCQILSGNDVISCFPTSDTIVPQHQWAAFIWNSRRPELTQTNRVNIYLFRADSRQQVTSFTNQANPTNMAGMITAQVDDLWFGTDGANWNGSNVSFPFYWIITRADVSLDDGNALPQATFSAVQTTFADSIIASRSSASAAAASSSAAIASLSSIIEASRTLTASSSIDPSASSSGSGSGAVQPAGSGEGFPHWAIAVIVVLGFLAICATGILIFFIIRRMRRNRSEAGSNRNSMGSSSPMMANAAQQQSPLLAGAALPHPASSQGHNPVPVAGGSVMHDGASTISRAGSAGDSGPFSGADAAIMADAFRKMLRKPEFPEGPPEEDSSPDTMGGGRGEMINRELAEEGRDIRSVSSSRNVRLETLSDSGDTVQEDHYRDRD
ncbi:hypothetical protein BDQ17DRAFT_1423898 [Cyathus striatus]|nr:hypothetical protein BDQ17DRAFT_1423898 [Cyathus striatus]